MLKLIFDFLCFINILGIGTSRKESLLSSKSLDKNTVMFSDTLSQCQLMCFPPNL